MIVSDVIKGGGLAAYGVAFYSLVVWQVRSDRRVRRLSESRWIWDHATIRKLRTGEISQEEWFDRQARGWRWMVKWCFTPAVVLWEVLAIAMLLHGLLSR